MLDFLFLSIQLLFAFLFFYLALAFLTGAPFVPSTKHAATTMIDIAGIKKGMTVYDLGSGDGRLLFLAAARGAKAIGLEINPYLVLYASIKTFFSPYRKNVRTYWKNFWRADFSKADVVFVYLLPWKMKRLEKKLLNELKPGSNIVSNSFIFPHIPCTKKDEAQHVYLFTVPKKRI
ncbi:MAG: methyltransferase domain-containing protein [Candidatus Gottesmanbacteria bacterium]